MSFIKKLFSAWMLGKTVSGATAVFTRILISMTVIAILAALAAVFLLLITVGLVWISYIGLVTHGFNTISAVFILIGVMIVLLIAAVHTAREHIRKMGKMSQEFLQKKSFVAKKVSKVSDAFMEGFMAEKARES